MAVLVQREAPNFEADAVMPDGSFQKIRLCDYRDKKYVWLFFWPLDFTFVCPTEIISISDRIGEFEKRNVQVLGVSVDSHYTHLAWRKTPRSEGGIGAVTYPLIADLSKSIASDYGVLLPGGVALRGSFLIDKKGIVRHEVVNDLPLGRSTDEALRVIDAWQFYEQHGEVCPADWHPGEMAMKADPEKSKEFFSKRYAQRA